jgi:predicted nucleotide-binding protein
MTDPKKVFIVHGRNQEAVKAMKDFLRAVGLNPHDFRKFRDDIPGSPYIGEILTTAFGEAQAVVVLFTPDEWTSLRPSLRGSPSQDDGRWEPRPNVVYEAGIAMTLDPKRTILTKLGNVSLPSDIAGRHYINLGNDINSKNDLRNLLARAGCEIDRQTVDHLQVENGDFEKCVALPEVSATTRF